MKLPRFFHRRSLTFCVPALLFALMAFADVPEFTQRLRWNGPDYLRHAAAHAGLAIVVNLMALFNLIADVERGYPSWRCQLAAVVLVFSCGLTGFAAFTVLQHWHHF